MPNSTGSMASCDGSTRPELGSSGLVSLRRDAMATGEASAQSWQGGRVMTMNTSALEARNVSKVYAKARLRSRLFNAVDLSVEQGELVAVIGPSGCGKTTLLAIAGTLEEPTSGEVLVDGTDVATLSRDDRARLRRRSIGYVFQDFNLLAGLTAAENVSLPLELDGIWTRRARALA